MILKFLFGTYRAKEEGKEEIKFEDTLFMFRKTHVLQHSDVAQAFMFPPSTGGFVDKLRAVNTMHFYGESISCRVRTDESMDELYADLLKNGSWWETEYEQNKCKYGIWVVLPKGRKPAFSELGYEWKPSSHKDMYDTLTAEDKTGYGW
ncbi:hypothetical protein PQD71_gp006 [Kosakonia phage Kc263]|uniref:Uncharacterized protein n=1 Tax=Kosakonia phage Kc263 TaxID=2863194 RepID=A0AAE8BII2_9CAUD|nr:hypothetical protein PQD71_gp006 [Kosakonia phage Kc263]QYN79899.1 hypothetical protein [Kosakonia phage Kc263]